MATEMLDNINLIILDKDTKEEVLEVLSNIAIEAGYAKLGYYEAILEREEKYPTGLHTHQVEVAIPHADAEWANLSSLTIGLLEKPVIFGPMGGEGGDVAAEIVFMLTIKDPKEQIDFLRAFSTMIQDPQVLLDFKKTGDLKKISDQIRKNM
jgi:galactitol PTS system EIIA component